MHHPGFHALPTELVLLFAFNNQECSITPYTAEITKKKFSLIKFNIKSNMVLSSI